METITLYFKDERSDKVYQAWLDRNNQLYDVKFAYGRRGGTLQTGTKNSTPLSLAQATALMTSLVREKQGKGYTQGESGAAYTATVNQDRFTGILPMLLNPIEEEALPMYLNDPLWIAEEKYDGVRMLLRINVDGSVDAINRKGLLVGAPQCILDEARGIAPGKFPLIIDGECVGEKFYAFDYICEAPLRERKHRLRSLKLNRFDHIEEVLYQDINKLKFFDQLRDNNAEGIVLKTVMRSTKPSTWPAKPKIVPDWSASTVFFPMTFLGLTSSTLRNCAARAASASTEISIPGARAPPKNSPLGETTSKFVDVPKSTTIAGPPNNVCAASVFTILSAPISFGLSTNKGTPVLIPGSTIVVRTSAK